MALEEKLELDVGSAIDSLDQLEARIGAAASAAGSSLSEAIRAGLDDGVASIQDMERSLAELGNVDVPVDTSSIEEANQDLSSMGDAIAAADSASVTVDVDDSDVTSASQSAASLDEALQAAGVDPVTLEVDDSQVDEAIDSLGGLAAAGEEAAKPVEVPVSADGADDTADELTAVSESSGEAKAGLDQTSSSATILSGSLDLVNSRFGLVQAGGAGVGGALLYAASSAIEASTSTRAAANTFGDAADQLERLQVQGLKTRSVADLSTSFGVDDDEIRLQLVQLGNLAIQSGETRSEAAKLSKEYLLLATALVSANPAIGTVDSVLARLYTTLGRGGPAAARLGLDIGTSADIAAAAGERYGKAAEDTTLYERSTVSLDRALQNIGPSLGSIIQAGADAPENRLAAVRQAISETIEAAGEPVALPLLDALESGSGIIDGATQSLGQFAGQGLGAILEVATPVLAVADQVLGVLAQIPTPVYAAAAGLVVGAKGFETIATASLKFLTSTSGLVSRLRELGDGNIGTGLVERLKETISTGEASKAQLVEVARTTEVARQAELKLSQAIDVTAAATEEGRAAKAAYERAQTASLELMDAERTKRQLQAAAIEAESAARSGAIDDVVAYQAAQTQLVAADEAVVVAEQAKTAAVTEFTAATQTAAATSAGTAAGLGGAFAEAGEAAAGVTAAQTAATSSSLSWSSALGPLGILLGVATGAALLFTSASDGNEEQMREEKQAVDDATESLKQYAEGLGLTARQAANLDQSQAREAFQSDTTAAEDFIAKLREAGQAGRFDKLKLDLAQAGQAINGDIESAKLFRQSLVDAGQVQIDTEGLDAAIRAAPEAAAGLYENAANELQRYIDTGKQGELLKVSPIAEEYDKQAAASRRAEIGILNVARAQIRSNGAGGVASIQLASELGLLERLTPRQEARARVLLSTAEAAERATDAAYGLEAAMGDAAGAAIDALQQIAAGQQPDLSGLVALRDLAGDPVFKTLPDDVQATVTAQLDAADAAREHAAAEGELVSDLGEVSTSLVELEDDLDRVIGKYQEISGETSDFQGNVRDTQRAIADLPDVIGDLGPSLNAASGRFDAASITLDNYQDVLSRLPKAVQDSISEIGQSEGSDKTAAKVALVRREIERLRESGQEPVTGLLERLTSKNVDAIEKLLPKEVQIGIDLQVDDVQDSKLSKSQVEAQKLAATRAAVARLSAADLAKLDRDTADNADQLNDYFSDIGSKVRGVVGDMLKADTPVRDILTTVGQFRDQITQAATAAGLPIDQVNRLLEREHLLEPQILQDFELSGVDEAQRRLDVFRTALSGLPPAELDAILKIEDPEKQRAAIDEAVAGLSVDAQVVVKAVLDAPSIEEAEAKVRALSQPVEVAVELGLTPEQAQSAAVQIVQWQQEHPGVQIQVTADTIAAVAAMNEAAFPGGEGRTAPINADDQGSATREKGKLDALEERRDAYIEAHVVPAAGSEEAFGWFGLRGAAQKALAKVDLQANDMSVLGEITGKVLRVESIETGGRSSSGGGRSSGSNKNGFAAGGPAPNRAFASGGTTRSLRELERDLVERRPQPGLYAGRRDGITFAEGTTGHEWFLTGDPAHREANERYLGMAADDFGFDLVPKGTQPVVVGGGSDPALRSEVAGLGSRLDTLIAEQQRNTSDVVGAVGAIPAGGDEINEWTIVAPSPERAAFAVADRQRAKARRK